AAPLADGCTTQGYMHTDHYTDCPYHHVTVTKDCSGVETDCHGVTWNGSGPSSECSRSGGSSDSRPQDPLGGGSVSLPCTLSPALNAETFEVLWHRPQEINTPVLSYKNPEDPGGPHRSTVPGQSVPVRGAEERQMYVSEAGEPHARG
ncbi:hypothetical protein NFI96_006500, partial [Prochilodus magdalenae]